MIDVKYNKLFAIELLHKYAADQTCNNFTIVPSLQTQQLLKNYHVITKQYGNILYGWIDLDPVALQASIPLQKPLIKPADGTQLTFFLLLNNPLFFNYTGGLSADNNNSIYYFSNRNNNISNNKKFLTATLPGYVNGHNYLNEDIVIDGGIVYESLKHNNSDNTSNQNSWRPVLYPDPDHPENYITDPNHFVSAADAVNLMPSISQFNFPSTQPITSSVKIDLTSYANNADTFEIIIDNPEEYSSLPLNLTKLKSGKYLLTVNDVNPAVPVYLNDELSNKKVFGVIDIFVDSTLPDEYKIFDNDDVLQSPLYSIYFLNRATIWKYILLRKTEAAITDTEDPGNYTFNTILPPATTTTVIQSQFSIPLSEKALKLKLDNNDTPLPPCATPNRLSRNTTDANDTHYYSEIFLNY